MWTAVLSVVLLGYLPGALAFRLPVARREHRAALPAEERVFWYIVISLAISSLMAFALAAFGSYRLDRLLWMGGALCAALAVGCRSAPRLPSDAPRPGWTALVPIVIAGLALWVVFYVPPSEYLMGGKDPGVYMNEGIQIAQRGTLTVTDPIVASIPEEFRVLFFQESDDPTYFSNRFMGFFLLDPDDGKVVGQFPHLYPIWIAIGYGVDGLTGARYIIGLWGVLGVMAVYFAGMWLVGRPAAAVGALLLSIHVAQVWYSRYPNAELLMQVFLFAGLLAFSRASVDGDRFFAPVAAVLATLAFLAHITAIFAIGALLGASVLGVFDGRRPQAAFVIPLVAGTAGAAAYYGTTLSPYVALPVGLYQRLPGPAIVPVAAGLVLIVAILWCARQDRIRQPLRQWIPWIGVGTLWGLAVYAYFFRVAGDRFLGAHDAEALRVFTDFYLAPIGLIGALIGLTLVARRSFWPGLAYMLTFGTYAIFFFYKTRVIPEHFWAARRFLPVILPAALLLVGAAAFAPSFQSLRSALNRPRRRVLVYSLGILVVLFLGQRYLTATRAILTHVEYAGLIGRLETLAARFDDADLVLFEARLASDMHVLALPLAYTYARNTLVFRTTDPNSQTFEPFLRWAKGRYQRVFFIGDGGTELLSPSIRAIPVVGERFQIPEYEQAYRAYPTRVTFKEFDYGIYELRPERVTLDRFEIDVGTMDDLFVRRFHAKEEHGSTRTSYRWTRDVSFVSLLGVSPQQRSLTLWLSSGGRPAGLPPATADLYLEGELLGRVTATENFEPYRFEIRAEIAAALGASGDAGRLRIESAMWNPGAVLGVPDDRDVGLMLDRVTVE